MSGLYQLLLRTMRPSPTRELCDLPSIGLEEVLGKRPALAAMMIVPARLRNRA